VHLRGRLVDARAGRIVELQVRRDGEWCACLGTTRTRKKGGFRAEWEFEYSECVRHYAFRAHVGAQPGYSFAAGSSKTARVKVRGPVPPEGCETG
jgi:hypothetical protein